MSRTRAISTTSRRELSSSFFFLQGKAPKEIRAILTETLVSFLPGRAKDLSASLYQNDRGHCLNNFLPIVKKIHERIPQDNPSLCQYCSQGLRTL